MKKSILFTVLVMAVFCLCSCGITSTTSNNISGTSVVLKRNNFRVLGQAYGQSKATYVFGMGGIRKRALRANAIDEMSRSAHLTGSQALVNITTHTSYRMITPLFVEITCDATANIIEFQ